MVIDFDPLNEIENLKLSIRNIFSRWLEFASFCSISEIVCVLSSLLCSIIVQILN